MTASIFGPLCLTGPTSRPGRRLLFAGCVGYTNFMGYTDERLPSERTLRDILNRMNYRLKRIQKGKPLKKTENTTPIFETLDAARNLESRLVYYPPYHSKYHPIERCWSSLQKKWNGTLLTCWQVVRVCGSRMTGKGQHPSIVLVEGNYPTGVIVPKQEMKEINTRLIRSEKLPSYDRLIMPKRPRGR